MKQQHSTRDAGISIGARHEERERARINDGGPDAPPPPPSKPIVLGGAIGQRYNELGGKKWGYPQHTEKATPDGRGRYVHFRDHPQRQGTTMSIYWSPETGAQIFGQIRNLWESLGWERSFLGYPTSGELATHDGVGRWQTFQGGIMVWHPDIGTFEVHGTILKRYTELGGSAWGYPTTNETKTPDGRGRFNHFRKLETGADLSIYWTPQTGAHEVFGLIRNGWASYGWERSALGYPTSGEMATHDKVGRWQTFERGIYVWHPTTGAHECTARSSSGTPSSAAPRGATRPPTKATPRAPAASTTSSSSRLGTTSRSIGRPIPEPSRSTATSVVSGRR